MDQSRCVYIQHDTISGGESQLCLTKNLSALSAHHHFVPTVYDAGTD